MTSQSRCRLLLQFRDKGVRFRTFMGVRWFVMKAMMVFVSVVMVSLEDPVAHTVGWVILGFALGMIVAGIRSYIVARRVWTVQKEFLDWQKIEACAKGPPPERTSAGECVPC